MEKVKKFWDKLPKEVKVLAYVALSGALAEILKYLELVQIDNLLLAAVINVVIVTLRERVPQVRAKLAKK